MDQRDNIDDYDSDDEIDYSYMSPAEVLKSKTEKQLKAQRELEEQARDAVNFFRECDDADAWFRKVEEMERGDLRMKSNDIVTNPAGMRNSSDNLFPFAVREFSEKDGVIDALLEECQEDVTLMEKMNPASFTSMVHLTAASQEVINKAYDDSEFVEVDIDDMDEAVGGKDRSVTVRMASGRWRNEDVFYEQRGDTWKVLSKDKTSEEIVRTALVVFDKCRLYVLASQPPSLPGGVVRFQEDSYLSLKVWTSKQLGFPVESAKKLGCSRRGNETTFLYAAPWTKNRCLALTPVPIGVENQKEYRWLTELLQEFVPSFKRLRPVWNGLEYPREMQFDDQGDYVPKTTMRKQIRERDNSFVKKVSAKNCRYLDFYFKFKLRSETGCVHRDCQCEALVLGQHQCLGYYFKARLSDDSWVYAWLLDIEAKFSYKLERITSCVTVYPKMWFLPFDHVDWACSGRKGKTGWSGYDIEGWHDKPKTGKLAVFIDGVSQNVHFRGDNRWRDVAGGVELSGEKLSILMPDGLEAHAVTVLRAVSNVSEPDKT